ncbi:MAG TPA: hypothetical protein VE268_09550 [Herpetosiphonaceae bacterium]|jgi:hypothetical protein|nr:hypothetical protein [Herpetosiphonaceae bacterium]
MLPNPKAKAKRTVDSVCILNDGPGAIISEGPTTLPLLLMEGGTMIPSDDQSLNQIMRLAPPEGTPENAKYIRYALLWVRVKERTVVLQSYLDCLQSEIAANIVQASAQALVTASERADRLAIVSLDVAQLMVFANDLYQRLLDFVP